MSSYYELNKERLKQYSRDYKNENIEVIREKNKEYKQKHKERLKIQNAIKIVCGCRRLVTKRHLNRHLKSDIHTRNLK